jgi:hypothetical protein
MATSSAAKSRSSTERSKISSEMSATRNWYSSSARFENVLMRTQVPPESAIPNIAEIHSERFVAKRPTRVSLPTPRATSARATFKASAQTCAYVERTTDRPAA